MSVENAVLESVATEWVTSQPLLSADDCAHVRTGIDALRKEWIQRHPSSPFYTLGTTNYFDITYNPMLPYYRMAARLNPILHAQFASLYDKLKVHLEERLGAPVAYRDGLALPGFHIFLHDEAFQKPQDMTHREWFFAKGKKEVVGNAIHCDTAHLVVNWEGYKQDDEKPISITLPIEMPDSGSGLNHWSFGQEATEHLEHSEHRAFLLSQPKEFFPYVTGEVVIHDGLRYHQMAAMRDMLPGEARITLQGHGVKCNGTWQLFW